MNTRSAWCSSAPGTRHSAAQHGMCQMRLDDNREKTCSCPDTPHHKLPAARRDGTEEGDTA